MFRRGKLHTLRNLARLNLFSLGDAATTTCTVWQSGLFSKTSKIAPKLEYMYMYVCPISYLFETNEMSISIIVETLMTTGSCASTHTNKTTPKEPLFNHFHLCNLYTDIVKHHPHDVCTYFHINNEGPVLGNFKRKVNQVCNRFYFEVQ